MTRGHVYDAKWRGTLEGSYMLNLGIFSVTTFYVSQAGANQAVVAYISTGVAFASFVGTVLFHVYMQMEEHRVWIVLRRCWQYLHHEPKHRQLQRQQGRKETQPLLDN